MNTWINKIVGYLNKFLEVGVLLLAVSVIAEILFGPDVAFFGSQVTKLIARRVRDLGVYSEIITPRDTKKIRDFTLIKGIILSGGPSTVTKQKFQKRILKLKFLLGGQM